MNQLGDKKSIATYNVQALAIDPESPNIVYAGSQNKGLFKTEDSGDAYFFRYLRFAPAGNYALKLAGQGIALQAPLIVEERRSPFD